MSFNSRMSIAIHRALNPSPEDQLRRQIRAFENLADIRDGQGRWGDAQADRRQADRLRLKLRG